MKPFEIEPPLVREPTLPQLAQRQSTKPSAQGFHTTPTNANLANKQAVAIEMEEQEVELDESDIFELQPDEQIFIRFQKIISKAQTAQAKKEGKSIKKKS